jgi:hypothetical protein
VKDKYMTKKTNKFCRYGPHHVANKIILRSKNDSYYLECDLCGDPGDVGLIATWNRTLPEWGLDENGTEDLHRRFAFLRDANRDRLATEAGMRNTRIKVGKNMWYYVNGRKLAAVVIEDRGYLGADGQQVVRLAVKDTYSTFEVEVPADWVTCRRGYTR